MRSGQHPKVWVLMESLRSLTMEGSSIIKKKIIIIFWDLICLKMGLFIIPHVLICPNKMEWQREKTYIC